jgi:hypothetical protein
LPTHLEPQELLYFEQAVPSLTYDISEAELVLGRLSKRERAEFELRRHKLRFRPALSQDGWCSTSTISPAGDNPVEEHPSPKRRRIVDVRPPGKEVQEERRIRVLKLSWLTDSLAEGKLRPMDDYLLFEAIHAASDVTAGKEQHETQNISTNSILRRAAGDHAGNVTSQAASSPLHFDAGGQSGDRRRPPSLTRQTTSEHDIELPAIPDFLHSTYSCQRPTPLDTPNNDFVQELKSIRTLRLLQGDQIGVRAYSTSIATLSAYPYVVHNPYG